MKHSFGDDCMKYPPEYEVRIDGEPVTVADLAEGDMFTAAASPGTLWRADAVHASGDAIHVATTDVTPADAITVSLAIENRYPGDIMIPTQVTDVVIPAPPPADDPAMGDWEYDNIRRFAGLPDRTSGDSWHDVTVIASSDPTLIGATYEFGY